MTYCPSWERRWEQLFDYLYQSNPLPRYLSLRSRRAVPAGVGRVYTGHTSNARAMLIVCQDLLGIIIPRMYHPNARVHMRGTTVRRFADVTRERRQRRRLVDEARCSLIWTSPHRRGRNLCSIYQGFMRWLLRAVTGLSKGLRLGYISHNATIRCLKNL